MERVPLSVRTDHQDFEVLAGRIQESRYFQNIDISLLKELLLLLFLLLLLPVPT